MRVSAGQPRRCVLHNASRILSAIIMSFLCCVGNAVKVIQGKRYQQQASVHHILQVASLDHDFHAIECFVWSAAETSNLRYIQLIYANVYLYITDKHVMCMSLFAVCNSCCCWTHPPCWRKRNADVKKELNTDTGVVQRIQRATIENCTWKDVHMGRRI